MHGLFVSEYSVTTLDPQRQIDGLLASDVQMLTQIGFIAAGAGDIRRAKAIFSGLQAVRPERAFAWVGEATAWMNAAQPAEAVRCLRAFQGQSGAEHDMVQAFLGLALQLDGQMQASVRTLQASAYQSVSPATEGMQLARQILGSDSLEDAAPSTSGDTAANAPRP